jgi:hypothetical protein
VTIDWSALGLVAGVSLLTAVILISLYSFGVHNLGRREIATETGKGSATAPLAIAVTCFAICAAVVVFGILLIAFPKLIG